MSSEDVTGGKPIAVWSQSILDVNAINPLVAFYDIHGWKREVILFYFVADTTRDTMGDFYGSYFHGFESDVVRNRSKGTFIEKQVAGTNRPVRVGICRYRQNFYK
jgi:hypothetical protein